MRAVLTTFSRSLAVLAVAFAPAAFASEPARPPLKEVYADAFHVGAAVYAERLSEADPSLRDLVAREFDSVSSRDMLKWAWLNPRPGVLEAEAGDAYVVFGEAQGMYTVGHVLFWHLETPEWVWRDAAGGDVSRDVLLGRMRERVRAVAARYGSRIKAWDVVNEALMENGTLRESPWSRILGESFVEEAFRIAGDELPPDVGLIYNDYNMHVAGKRRAVVDMIGRLKAQGLRIDGVGMQGHWHLDDPPPRAIEASIEAFHRAGVDVHVSELDVSVLPDAKGERTDGNDPYRDGLPAEVARRQADRYAALFGLFRKHADKIKRVTLWGVSDAHSFKNNFPIAGRTDHPMLFDRQGRPKPAYDAVVDVGLRGTSAASPAPRPFAWSCDGPFIDEENFADTDWVAMKDPSIVRHDGRWHLFCTLRGHRRSHSIVYTSFKEFDDADPAKPVVLPNHAGYFCAPQVFYYRPHEKWYLVCQAKNPDWSPPYQAAFATTDDVADPASWTPLEPMGVARPADDARSPFLDFWVIRDGETVYNFFTSDNGKMWRCRTSVEAFPFGWTSPELAYRGDIFEAGHIYRLPDGRFANLVEATARGDRRLFKIFYADRLDGPWRKPSGGDALYAGVANIDFGDDRWADSISHGELLRSGVDETMEATLTSPFVFQGVLMKDRRVKAYGKIPWKLGVLRPESAPKSAHRSP